MKKESKLVTYVAGSAKSTVDYIMIRQGDKVKVRNVKVIPNEECVQKHKLLVMDMRFNTTTRMWANAQRDGRPAEHRWRLLFNAAKFC